MAGLPKEPALRAIIFYKLVKGSASLAVALVLVAAVMFHFEHQIHDLAEAFREHVVRIWAVRVAEMILEVSDRKHIEIASAALFFDGGLTLTEGVGLSRGWWWAPWLVVVATSVFLPFEILSLVHHLAVGRVLVFLANLAIVIYLARRTMAEHRLRSAG